MSDIYSRTFHLGGCIAEGGDKLGQTVLDAVLGCGSTHLICSVSKTDFKTETLIKKRLKTLHFFYILTKAVKTSGGNRRMWAPPTDPRMVLLLLQTFWGRFSTVEKRLIAVENNKSNNSFCFFPICLIFTSNSAVYLGGAKKHFLPPDARYVTATALVLVNNRGYKRHRPI